MGEKGGKKTGGKSHSHPGWKKTFRKKTKQLGKKIKGGNENF